MKKTLITSMVSAILCATLAWTVQAAAAGRDPANVVVAKITRGTIAPENTFIGTVYYPEVSDVSAEVEGRVETVTFDEGRFLTKGAILVQMDSSLLQKTIQSKKASHEQVLVDLTRATKDLERTKNLYERKIVAEKDLDDQIYTVQGLGKKAASLKADVERLEIELAKKTIRAPFNGIVIKKTTAVGEWLSPGSTVATIAKNGAFDIIVSVPEDVLPHLRKDMNVQITAGGVKTVGTIIAIIPKGDIATRTFPIKIRVTQAPSLMEGMEARVKLPAARSAQAYFVPRDAVLTASDTAHLVAIVDGKAALIKVRVVGYQGMMAGVEAEGVKDDMKVVVKGNERLKEGDPVTIIKEIE